MIAISNFKSGFTLIELIVIFTTIAFLSIVGIASYVTYSQSQSLQAATQDLVTTIQLAKSRANSQVKPATFPCVGKLLDRYRVEVSISNNKYTLYVICGGDLLELQTTTLPNNITFNSDTNVSDLFFAVITGKVEGYGKIVIEGYGKTKIITIDSAGVIKVE